MICARGKRGDKQLILIGLSRENVQALTDGHPILMRPEVHRAIPPDWVVMIMFGETEQDMQEDLVRVGALNPQTVIHAESRP